MTYSEENSSWSALFFATKKETRDLFVILENISHRVVSPKYIYIYFFKITIISCRYETQMKITKIFYNLSSFIICKWYLWFFGFRIFISGHLVYNVVTARMTLTYRCLDTMPLEKYSVLIATILTPRFNSLLSSVQSISDYSDSLAISRTNQVTWIKSIGGILFLDRYIERNAGLRIFRRE